MSSSLPREVPVKNVGVANTPKALHSSKPRVAQRTLGYRIEIRHTLKGCHEGRCMPQSLAQIYLHVVFSTKYRTPYLCNPTIREDLYQYVMGICTKLESPSMGIGGVADHIHILCRLSKNMSVATFLRELKRSSSVWCKSEFAKLPEFQWQSGYGAFSFSPSHLSALKRYIANQEEHHKTETFQDEFRRLCKKYEVPIDERYVWD